MISMISTKDMRILDENSEWFGVPKTTLMRNAGKAVAREAKKLGKTFIVFAGSGNNGGDAYAAAVHLGRENVRVFYTAEPKSEQAIENFDLLIEAGFNIVLFDKKIRIDFRDDVIIDGLLGIGIKGRIRDPVRQLIALINKQKNKKLSIDVPSGVDPDSGRVQDIAVVPDVTVTFHEAKAGLTPENAGRIIVAPIGIPNIAKDHIGRGDFIFNFRERDVSARKGESGRVLVVGGCQRYIGATYFASKAALYSGCDLVYVATPKETQPIIRSMSPDIINVPLKSERDLSMIDIDRILEERADCLCIGNGLGLNKESLDVVAEIVKHSERAVIDGDGLRAIKPKDIKENMIITPHAGEFERLFGEKPPNDPVERSKLIKKNKVKGTVLLKGPVDVVVQGGNVKFNDSGNPYMSKGGTGDVLAGLCAGFLAQGYNSFESACFGAFINGLAGEVAYHDRSVSMTSTDVLESIPEVFRILLEE